jgi:NADPH:quinone reductase-like Zn-dependent oxidoreductase
MKAIVHTEYGPPEGLQLKEVDKPTPQDDEVLIAVHAASIVWADLAMVRGKPFVVRLTGGAILKPKYRTPGIDVAGRVEAVGRDVKQFQPGDEVFGDLYESGLGGFAEYACAGENALAPKPAGTTWEEAAAVPQAAGVALQGLRDMGQIQPGQRVLINGASGGNGTFAVQIAKWFGAEVTGVCSAKSLDLVRSLCADQVIDYAQEDFTKGEQHYDLVFDIVANRSVSDYMRVLSSEGAYVACAFSPVALVLGGLISRIGSKKVVQLSHSPNDKDLVLVKELIEDGKVRPVIDRSYPLSEVPEALRYYGEGHPQGKVVITVEHINK